MLKKELEAIAVLLLFLQANVTIDTDEPAQLIRSHFLIILSRHAIRAFDSMQRDAVRPQDAPYFRQHRILFFKADVADNVETYNIIKSLIGKGQVQEAGGSREVITIPAPQPRSKTVEPARMLS